MHCLEKNQSSARALLQRILCWMACSALFLLSACGKVDIAWTEDVALQDGTVLLVKRTAQGKKIGEIGGTGGWEVTQMTLEVMAPATPTRPPIWADRWVPMLLDRDAHTGEWFLIATFYTCTDWYDLGRPKLPYVAYETRNGHWEKVRLRSEWFGRKNNLLTGPSSGGEPKHLTVEEKARREAHAGRKYRQILDSWNTSC